MEKYARQAVSEGVKNAEDLHVGGDSEIYRVLNLHYNRNNHIEVWGPQVRKYTNTHTYTSSFHLIFRYINIEGLKSSQENFLKVSRSLYEVYFMKNPSTLDFLPSPSKKHICCL